MLTNGHAMMGYKDAEAHVPQLPFSTRRGHGLHAGHTEVVDAGGCWMATFRNSEDASIYMAERAAQFTKGRAAYDRMCERSAQEDAPEGKERCKRCKGIFVNVTMHRRNSTKCKATGAAP